MNREQSINQYASTLGFDRCGIARCRPLEERRDQLQQWLDQGHHGGLTYMERNLDKRLDPTLLVEGARSIIVCAISYKRPPAQGLITRFASYAWGRDYHSVLKEKLRALFAHIQELIPNTTGRLFVDTAPILEKSWAAEAGDTGMRIFCWHVFRTMTAYSKARHILICIRMNLLRSVMISLMSNSWLMGIRYAYRPISHTKTCRTDAAAGP